MHKTRQRIASVLILACMAQALLGCDNGPTPVSEFLPTPGQAAPAAGVIETQNSAYAFAQATLDYGRSQLVDLSRKSTEASLKMAQAANAAVQSTRDYNQRQKLDLDYQSTIVSQNIAQAAATQEFLTQQTQIAGDATAAAQGSAATATQFAFSMNVTQTAHAQAILEAQDVQTAQAVAALTTLPLTATAAARSQAVTETVQAQALLNIRATQAAQVVETMTAYPLTATPLAVTKAALLMQQYEREQQSFVDRVVAPLIPFLVMLVLLLFIAVIILAYRRFLPAQRLGRLPASFIPASPLIMIDGVITDHGPRLVRIIPPELTPASPFSLPGEKTVQVEIVNPAELPVAHWIAEVERQLVAEGGLEQ